MLVGTGTCAIAGESLPPLRVDPTLLGGAPIKPQQPASAPEAKTAPAPQTESQAEKGVAKASSANTSDAAPLPRSEAQVKPVEPPPASRDLPPAGAERVAAPAATLPALAPAALTAQTRTAAALPSPVNPPAKAAAAAPLAKNLPPLRVDPALLGGASLPAVAIATQPPQVAEQPGLPSLYSAHVAAGAFPHPATTAFSNASKDAAPTVITARGLKGVNEQEAIAEGEALLQRAGDSLYADRIVYRQVEDELEATGNVRLLAPDSDITGPRLRLRMEESTGEFESPVYVIRRQRAPVDEPALTLAGLPAVNESGKVLVTTGRKLPQPPVTGSGQADRLEFRGEDRYYFENASYSTCSPGKRDWEIVVDELDLDYTEEHGKGRNAVVRFLDVPLFYTPWMSFALNNQRKSGFLPPTLGTTSKSGFEVAAPYYWNIAPNMDATITPRVLSRRGVQLNAEFGYLLNTPSERVTQPWQQHSDMGQIRLEYLPDDKQANRDRYGYSIIHSQSFGSSLVGSVKLNGVSDDDYFSDLSTRVAQVSQSNLLRQAKLTYEGAWIGATLNVQSYQTLKNLEKPYQRLPQVTINANRDDLPAGLALNLVGEYVNFAHDDKWLGKRTTLYPQLSLPVGSAAFFVTPKIGVHATHYELSGLDRPLAAAWRDVPASQSRSVPIMTVDSGAFLERDTNWFGQELVQTLEPRAYYVFIPSRDQSKIPLFDTARTGFNYASMFTENRYAGGDRIGNANELTLALTSRMLDARTGSELLRATVGQRYYFTLEDDQASLPGEALRKSRKADLLTAITGKILPDVYADAAWQYSPDTKKTERFTLGGRYRPEIGKILNAGYRYVRDPVTDLAAFEQIDVSAQWPLFGGWHGVGRYNYSIKERRVIETIGGLEYNAGCWVGRFVVQRLATIADKPTTALFFQLELNDFSKIGSNPMQLLRRNIPGYGVINQPTADPVFAED
ncbi:LPS-assembly protein LptD [Rhodocyclaceae bacterium]